MSDVENELFTLMAAAKAQQASIAASVAAYEATRVALEQLVKEAREAVKAQVKVEAEATLNREIAPIITSLTMSAEQARRQWNAVRLRQIVLLVILAGVAGAGGGVAVYVASQAARSPVASVAAIPASTSTPAPAAAPMVNPAKSKKLSAPSRKREAGAVPEAQEEAASSDSRP